LVYQLFNKPASKEISKSWRSIARRWGEGSGEWRGDREIRSVERR